MPQLLPLTEVGSRCAAPERWRRRWPARTRRTWHAAKAVADPVRLQLLSIIRAADAHEACVCDLTDAVGLAQPTVSHHLKVLTDAGLLTRERRGSWAWFSLVPARLDDVASIFS